MSNAVSSTLIQQRVRNRIVEYFEIASSFQEIGNFGAFEVIEMWEDWVNPADLTFLAEPVFSLPEQDTIRQFCVIWEVCASETEENIFDTDSLSKIDSWQIFRNAAASALNVFFIRGKFSENSEDFRA